MHRKMVLALRPSMLPREALKTAKEEWARDSEGTDELDRERFDFCWFELADAWVANAEAEDYAQCPRKLRCSLQP